MKKPKKPKNKLDNMDEWQPKRYACRHCKDSGICQKCQGEGCMDCSYIGLCEYCADKQHKYLEGLA